MVQQEMAVANPAGFHARPAALLVAQAAKFKAKITVLSDGKTLNAKSLLNVLGGGIRTGAQIVVMAEGEDEREALAAVCRVIETLPE